MGKDNLDGNIDELRIYNRALSADEVQELYLFAEAKRKTAEEQKQQLAEEVKRQEEERKRVEAEQRRIAEAKRKAAAERKRQEELAALRQKQESKGEWTESNTGMKFRRIPGGRFRMGSSFSEKGRYSNEQPHTVRVGEFWLGETEVTQAQWQAIMGSNPSEFRGSDLPVENVNFNDVQEFIRKLNNRTWHMFRLPTEAEWEYAARAGTQTTRYWGDGIGRNNANCNGCGSRWDYKQTAPVRSFTPNTFGLHDMLGNVYEWTCSEYKDHYDGRSEQKCSLSADYYSLRGGSWYNLPRRVRAANRVNFNFPDLRYNFIGFRLARDIEMTEEESNAEDERKRQEEPPKKVEPVVVETPIKTYVTNEPSTSKQSDYEAVLKDNEDTVSCGFLSFGCEDPLKLPPYDPGFHLKHYRRVKLYGKRYPWLGSEIELKRNEQVLVLASGKVTTDQRNSRQVNRPPENALRMRIGESHNGPYFLRFRGNQIQNGGSYTFTAQNQGELQFLVHHWATYPPQPKWYQSMHSGSYLLDVFVYDNKNKEGFQRFLRALIRQNPEDSVFVAQAQGFLR